MVENGPALYSPKPKRCRHRHFWAFKAFSVKLPMLWCYQCGAIKNGEERWVRPTGVDGPNPWKPATPPTLHPTIAGGRLAGRAGGGR